jgi:hypothetical protein
MHIVAHIEHTSSPDGAQRNPGIPGNDFPDSVSLHPGYAVNRI